MSDLRRAADVHRFLQDHMRAGGLTELDPVTANAILARAGVLRDSNSRPGKPLRDLLRAGLIPGAYQVPNKPNGRWHIPLLR